MATPYQTLSETERALTERLTAQARATDEWEGYRHPHATRIADIADALGQALYLAPQDRAVLRWAALAHDFGMLLMRRDYVKRSGPLSLEEQLDLARHPIIGEQEAARLGAPRAVQLLVRWHHEAWNGMGYPDMLQRDQIPFSARILHVADAYAALTDDRPYRPARTEKDALRFISENAGLSFDPSIVQTLLALEDFPALHSFVRTAPPPAVLTAGPVFVPDALHLSESANLALPPTPATPRVPELPAVIANTNAPETTHAPAPPLVAPPIVAVASDSAAPLISPQSPATLAPSTVTTPPPALFADPTPPPAMTENLWPVMPIAPPRLPVPVLTPPAAPERPANDKQTADTQAPASPSRPTFDDDWWK